MSMLMLGKIQRHELGSFLGAALKLSDPGREKTPVYYFNLHYTLTTTLNVLIINHI